MNTSATAVADALREGRGVIVRRQHPKLDRTIAWLFRTGELVRLCPGVYCARGTEEDPLIRIRAVLAWCPDGILTGTAAAKVSFWPDIKVRDITVATRSRKAGGRATPGFRVERRIIPPDLVVDVDHVRYTNAALTALDLCSEVEGDGIDQVLRTGKATLKALNQAFELTRFRAGNLQRRQLLLESRQEPWSKLERRGHKLLRDAGITGWLTNYRVEAPTGCYLLDIAFPEAMLVIELDGFEHHSAWETFQSDRYRQNWLVCHGWRVLRFTWQMLVDTPELFIQRVRAALESVPQPAVRRGRAA